MSRNDHKTQKRRWKMNFTWIATKFLLLSPPVSHLLHLRCFQLFSHLCLFHSLDGLISDRDELKPRSINEANESFLVLITKQMTKSRSTRLLSENEKGKNMKLHSSVLKINTIKSVMFCHTWLNSCNTRQERFLFHSLTRQGNVFLFSGFSIKATLRRFLKQKKLMGSARCFVWEFWNDFNRTHFMRGLNLSTIKKNSENTQIWIWKINAHFSWLPFIFMLNLSYHTFL